MQGVGKLGHNRLMVFDERDISPQIDWSMSGPKKKMAVLPRGHAKTFWSNTEAQNLREFMDIAFSDFGEPANQEPANQDYEDAKELIREVVDGDRWQRFLKSKKQPRRSHHRFGATHRSKRGE